MLKSRGFWYLMMAGAVLGWVFIVVGLVRPFRNETLKKLWKSLALTWLVGHPLELVLSRGIGAAAGVSPAHTLVKTIVYGFTWWLPVRLGVFKA
ncbi:MAG TPA: hypothetical protein PLR71_08890 [Deltaproteobacteria bacterium]|nr:hypothetical protein [Deltaproteobacteria bacterium]